ncbi:hypothetical protein HYPSUDRAFT_213897 [Hypholoma sublateritium FD-334 SS-4]|uniref:Uncharacterized protein n=1 Tax=Hypholoma sublateritium (strain FD-334 SS-4) TaxID=945553 RepID=A0A0D2MNS0_HYPSF|nr:hypothetical protein HYPSUDRAFT_213897 [Hypholoma sublateritium FD-334 SS-4]
MEEWGVLRRGGGGVRRLLGAYPSAPHPRYQIRAAAHGASAVHREWRLPPPGGWVTFLSSSWTWRQTFTPLPALQRPFDNRRSESPSPDRALRRLPEAQCVVAARRPAAARIYPAPVSAGFPTSAINRRTVMRRASDSPPRPTRNANYRDARARAAAAQAGARAHAPLGSAPSHGATVCTPAGLRAPPPRGSRDPDFAVVSSSSRCAMGVPLAAGWRIMGLGLDDRPQVAAVRSGCFEAGCVCAPWCALHASQAA